MSEADRSSPIRLEGAVDGDAPRLVTDPWSGSYRIAHIGRTLSLTPAPGATAWVGAARWELAEIHVHHPPEHIWPALDGQAEFHLVHRDADGGFLVLGVVVVPGAEAHPAIAAFLADAPASGGERDGSAPFAPYALLPENRSNWRYEGSLTTPPFTPGVNWICFEHPIAASAEQLATLRAAFPPNAATPLPLGSRTLTCCS